MTLEGIAEQLKELKDTVSAGFKAVDQRFDGVDEKFKGINEKFKGIDEQFKGVDEQFKGIGEQFKGIGEQFKGIGEQFKGIDQKLNDAKVRDEELRGLMKFGLEANVALRESMETRFEAVNKKQDEEIGLLKDVIRSKSAR